LWGFPEALFFFRQVFFHFQIIIRL
jgi:hypothetical protein